MNLKHVLIIALWLPLMMAAGACKPGAPGETAPAAEEGQPGVEPPAAAGSEEAAPGGEAASDKISVDQDRPAVTLKVMAPASTPPPQTADPVGQGAAQVEHSLPVKKPDKDRKATPILVPDSEPKTAFDKCMKLCGEQNMMRAVAWEVIEADCRAECKGK